MQRRYQLKLKTSSAAKKLILQEAKRAAGREIASRRGAYIAEDGIGPRIHVSRPILCHGSALDKR